MGTQVTPIQRGVPAQAVTVRDSGGPALAQLGGIARQVQQFGLAEIEAQNADRLNTTTLDATRKLNDMALGFQQDPDQHTAASRFADDAAKLHDDLAGKLPDEESRARFTSAFGHLSEARRIDVAAYAVRVQTDEANANVLDALDEYSKQAANAKNPAERLAIVTQASHALEGAVSSRVMRAQVAAKLGKDFRERLATLDARRAIDADPAAGIKAIKAGAFEDLDPLEAQRQIERGEAEVLARQREARAAMRDARADAREALRDLETINQSGLPLSPEAADQAARLVAGSGDKTIHARFNRILQVSSFIAGMRGAKPDEVQGALSELEARAAKNGADEKLAAGVLALRHFASAQGAGLREDPLMYAQAQGRAKVTDIKLDGSAAPQDWRARVQQGDRVAAWYGTRPTYLTKQEHETLTAALAPTQPLQARQHILQNIAEGLGPRAPRLFAQIAPSDPVLANAGALMARGSKDAARDALIGQGLLQNKNDGRQSDLRPSASGRNQLPLVSDLGIATGLAGQAGRGQVLATADAIFAARAAAKGLTGADVGNGNRDAVEIYERALNEAAGGRYDDHGTQWGGLGSFNGVPVVVPNAIPADSFEDAVHGLTDKALETHSVTGAAPMVGDKKLTAKDLRRLYPITVGDGLYMLSTTDPRRSVNPVHDAKGQPYRFSLLNAFDHK